MNTIKKTILGFSFLAGIVYLSASCGNTTTDAANEKASSHIEQINRGEYLVNAIGCDDCHSPKRMGAHGPELVPELRFSGYPSDRPLPTGDLSILNTGMMVLNQDLTCAYGPWGLGFAANITSDSTGIGSWTEDRFIKSIREGKSKGIEGNRDLLPIMPWQNFKKLTDDDLKAIYAYLQSTQPVHNVVPAPIPPDVIMKKKA